MLLVAMLLLVESNAQLFKQTYTMWTDLLAMMQIALLTCGLLETWMIYVIAIRRPHLSDAIDAVMFYVFPLFYILMVSSMVLYAQGEDVGALILVFLGLFLLIYSSTHRVARMMLRRRERLEAIVTSLVCGRTQTASRSVLLRFLRVQFHRIIARAIAQLGRPRVAQRTFDPEQAKSKAALKSEGTACVSSQSPVIVVLS